MLQYFCADGINSCSLSCVAGRLENLKKKRFAMRFYEREMIRIFRTCATLTIRRPLVKCDPAGFPAMLPNENGTNDTLGMLFRYCLR